MEDEKIKSTGPSIKKVAIFSAILFVIAVAGGLAMIAVPFHSMNSALLMGPLQIISIFPFIAILLAAGSGFCIAMAFRKPNLWWLMPVGTCILAIGWLASCKIFLNLIEKRIG